MRPTVLLLAACAALGAADGDARPRQLFAHYMGCFPVATGPTAHHRAEQDRLRPETTDFLAALGGRTRNWDLVPPALRLSARDSAALEIRRARRAGVDGFAMDAWAGDKGAKAYLDALFEAAEAEPGDQPFALAICLDASCLPKDPERPGNMVRPYAEAIRHLLAKHGGSRCLARRDGRPLVFGYSSYGILQDAAMKALPEGPEKWQRTVNAYREVERLVGQPLFFHFCTAHFGHYRGQQPGDITGFTRFMAGHFGAVGAFLDGGELPEQALADGSLARTVRDAGAEWSEPMWYQYENVLGKLHAPTGTALLRERWRRAIAHGSTLIQFVTWNDYGENTVLAPGYQTNYAISELNAHYARWWKTGVEPKPEQDRLIVTYRAYPAGSTVFPFRSRREAEGVLEVVSLLTAPATVRLPGRGDPWEAPAGLAVRTLPLVPGPVRIEARRGGATVLAFDAPEPITDAPFREDNGLRGFTSDHDSQWALDFGPAIPLRVSEYGDADGDELPNWFEMLWQRRWLDFGAMTQLDPASDPWGAGRTLLESYRQRKDPTRPDAVYRAGTVWDLAAIPAAGISFNPDRDPQGSPVWSYHFRHGPYGRIGREGAFQAMTHAAPDTPYTGRHAHLSPSKDPVYQAIHGWTSWRRDAADAPWWLELRPRREAMVAVAWTSPVAGTVRLRATARAATADPLWLGVRDGGGRILAERVLGTEDAVLDSGPVPVAPGDRLLLAADSAPGTGAGAVRCTTLTVDLVSTTGTAP